MAVVTRLIDAASTQHHDYDYTALGRYLIGNQSAVLSFTGTDLVLTWTTLSAGTAVVKCTRTSNVAPFTSRDFLCLVQLSTDETVSVANNRKIFIEVDESLVNNSALITDATGLSVSSLKSEAAYPTNTNYIALYEVDGVGTVTDVRNIAKVSGSQIDLSTYTGNISITGDLTVSGTTTTNDLSVTNAATIATANITDLNVTNAPNFPAGTQISGVSPATIATTVEATAAVDNTKALWVKDGKDLYWSDVEEISWARGSSGTEVIAHNLWKPPKLIHSYYHDLADKWWTWYYINSISTTQDWLRLHDYSVSTSFWFGAKLISTDGTITWHFEWEVTAVSDTDITITRTGGAVNAVFYRLVLIS